MVVGDILLALILGIIFALIYSVAFRSRAGKLGSAFVFLLFFLIAWAGGLWIRPFGPTVLGVYWLPGLLLVTLLLLLLISLATDTTPPRKKSSAEIATERAAITAVGMAFWVLVLFLIGVIMSGYLL